MIYRKLDEFPAPGWYWWKPYNTGRVTIVTVIDCVTMVYYNDKIPFYSNFCHGLFGDKIEQKEEK
jgi:hypothetical protein